MSKLLFALFGSVVLVAGASSQPPAEDPGIATVRAAYMKAVNADDAAALAALYTTDGVEMPPNAPAQRGRSAIEAYHKKLSTEVKFSNLTITPTQTRVHGDTAHQVGTYTQRVAPTGGKPYDDRGKFIVLLQKQADGSWLLSHAIYNSDLPMPSMGPKT